MKTLQKFLGVKDDGDVGPATLAAATSKLKSLNMLPHTGVVGFRSDGIFDDRFPDYLCAVKNSKVAEIIHGTTTPGIKIALNFIKYNPVGVGIWAEDELFVGSHVFSTEENKYGSPMFWQRKTIKVYRDGNKDNVLDKKITEIAGPEKTFQLHMMGAWHWVKGLLGGWSAGCMGAPKDEWVKLIRHFNHGDVCSTGVVRMS